MVVSAIHQRRSKGDDVSRYERVGWNRLCVSGHRGTLNGTALNFHAKNVPCGLLQVGESERVGRWSGILDATKAPEPSVLPVMVKFSVGKLAPALNFFELPYRAIATCIVMPSVCSTVSALPIWQGDTVSRTTKGEG